MKYCICELKRKLRRKSENAKGRSVVVLHLEGKFLFFDFLSNCLCHYIFNGCFFCEIKYLFLFMVSFISHLFIWFWVLTYKAFSDCSKREFILLISTIRITLLASFIVSLLSSNGRLIGDSTFLLFLNSWLVVGSQVLHLNLSYLFIVWFYYFFIWI